MEEIKMKKTYIAPSLEVVFVEVSNLMQTISNAGDISNAEADAREGGLVWELEEVSEEN